MPIDFTARMTRSEVAAALAVSPSRISQLGLTGASLGDVLAHLRQRILDASRDDAIRAVRLEREKIKLEKEEGALIDANEALHAVTLFAGAFRAELEGLPAAVSRDPQIRAQIGQQVDAILGRLAGRAFDMAKTLRGDQQ